jgi:metal-responsive CopG/Arc/MetJ family transcriptional regulator
MLLIRLPEELLADIDQMNAAFGVKSRSKGIRGCLSAYYLVALLAAEKARVKQQAKKRAKRKAAVEKIARSVVDKAFQKVMSRKRS